MDESKRNMFTGLGAILATCLLPVDSEAAQREAKPLTTAGLAKSLLTLADKAERQGMTREAQAIYKAVREVMEGSPAKGGRQ